MMTEAEFLQTYDASVYARPSTAVDSAIFTVREGELCVLLIQREEHPALGQWSLVGGYVDIEKDDDLEATALRKLREKTGFDSPYLEQVQSIGGKTRDPRGWTISTLYYALVPYTKMTIDEAKARLVPVSECQELAFDHEILLQLSLERVRNKALYTTLPVHLMAGDFTLSELQAVYECIIGHKIQAKSFRRRMEASGVIEETGEMKETSRRPAMTYRLVAGAETHFFTRNIESVNL